MTTTLRNVAIIAHVDHGKTTLVDQLLKQSGMFRAGELDKLAGGQHGLIMDSNPIERERGITILSKNCAVTYTRPPELAKDGLGDQIRINIVDTPGHADFGGEVERVLRLADGCLLLVDAYDGPMPQTRFVLGKAIEAGLKPVVVVNKCDRPDARPSAVVDEVFELLIELGADDHALEFPVVYASGRDGWATDIVSQKGTDMRPVFEAIVKHVPPAGGDADAPLQMLITTLDYSEYVGRIGIGRVFQGTIKRNQQVAVLDREGKRRNAKVAKLMAFAGLGRTEVESVSAGDLCAVIGIEGIDIGVTLADPTNPVALPTVRVDEPTLTMVFRVNDSPFAGQEGQYVTSRQIRDRLERECEHNVALRVETGESEAEFVVSGRGLLHLGILLENMRREGFELAVGKPRVVIKEVNGELHEPIERLVVDAPNGAVGSVMELVGSRKGDLKKMEPRGDDVTHMLFEIPSRALIGLRGKALTATQGQAILHHSFVRFSPVSGDMQHRLQGVLVASESNQVTTHACELMAERGILFVSPGDKVYAGQIVGEHNRDNDLVVNATRTKQLTNFRVSGKEDAIKITPPIELTLEYGVEFIEDDELVEITPKSIRLRKRFLKEHERKRASRENAA